MASAPDVCPIAAPARGLPARAQPCLVVVATGSVRIDAAGSLAVVPAGHVGLVPAGARATVVAAAPSVAWTLRLTGPLSPALPALSVHAAAPVLAAVVRDGAEWGPARPPADVRAAWHAAILGLTPRWIGPARPLTLSKGADPALRRALAALLPRLGHPVGLTDAAIAAGVSSRTLQRRCTRDLGMPLSAWLTRARVLLAVELLAQTGDPVSEVATRCGYQSAAAFTRAFSQQLGSTPSAWRPKR